MQKSLELEIEKRTSEMIRIHQNTFWWGISEKKANKLGNRITQLGIEIKALRDEKDQVAPIIKSMFNLGKNKK
jgi:hypothetical protein